MSMRIREMLKARQNAMAPAASPVDLDNARADLVSQLRLAIERDSMSPDPIGGEQLARMYEPLLGEEVVRQILDRYHAIPHSTLQDDLADPGALMAPMLASVRQLDRQ